MLNKLTPETFDKFVKQAEAIELPNSEFLEVVCTRMFEKALLEASFASMYSQVSRFLFSLRKVEPTFVAVVLCPIGDNIPYV